MSEESIAAKVDRKVAAMRQEMNDIVTVVAVLLLPFLGITAGLRVRDALGIIVFLYACRCIVCDVYRQLLRWCYRRA